jgi:hypothetical protein
MKLDFLTLEEPNSSKKNDITCPIILCDVVGSRKEWDSLTLAEKENDA